MTERKRLRRAIRRDVHGVDGSHVPPDTRSGDTP
jgi:hypothetical protein